MAGISDGARRRLDEVFGEVLPTVTRDEQAEPAAPGGDGHPAHEEWLRANRPPHHDRD
jgi:hypothetical protein